MKLTPWFDGSTTPAYPGVYERKYRMTPDKTLYCFWDGVVWYQNGDTPEQALSWKKQGEKSLSPYLSWRGLAEQPK